MISLIKITDQEIGDGFPYSCGKCPTALAIQKVLADGYYAKVGSRVVYIQDTHCHTKQSLGLPTEIQEWIVDFDNGKLMKPINFYLSIDKEYVNANQSYTRVH